jgi:hypothetical protein
LSSCTTGSFLRTAQLQGVCYLFLSIPGYKNEYKWLLLETYSLWLIKMQICLNQIIISSATKKCSEKDNDSGALRKSLQKWWQHWRRYQKIVSRNASQSFTNVGKSILNQFQELFEASSITQQVISIWYITTGIVVSRLSGGKILKCAKIPSEHMSRNKFLPNVCNVHVISTADPLYCSHVFQHNFQSFIAQRCALCWKFLVSLRSLIDILSAHCCNTFKSQLTLNTPKSQW